MSGNLPLPPPDLRARVGPGSDEVQYEDVGRACRDAVLAALPDDLALDGKRILDFGCGAGRTLRHFVDDASRAELWGCDVHAPSIDWLREHASPPLNLFVNDLLPPLAVDDESFDVVYGLSVFTHLADDWAAWLAELHRILRPDGIAVLTFLGAPVWERILGDPFFHDELKRPWNDDTTGMFVTSFGLPQDDVGPIVFHSEWWLRAHWGRAFDIVRIEPWGFAQPDGARQGHGWVTLRKRAVALDGDALEVIDPSDARELRAMQANLAYVQREMAAWRRLATAAGGAYEAEQARAEALAREVDELRRVGSSPDRSASWSRVGLRRARRPS
jgi:SAM-dependent methyltransferase